MSVYLSELLSSYPKWCYHIYNYDLCVLPASFFFSQERYLISNNVVLNKIQLCCFRTSAGQGYYSKHEFLEKLEIDSSH